MEETIDPTPVPHAQMDTILSLVRTCAWSVETTRILEAPPDPTPQVTVVMLFFFIVKVLIVVQ